MHMAAAPTASNLLAGTGGTHIRKESINVIAEMVGVAKLPDKVASVLARSTEQRLREVISDAMKFMKHSHRDELTTDDVTHALRLKNIPALYGFASSDPLTFRAARGTDDLFFVEDTVVTCDELVTQPLPKAPADTTFSVHWLAVGGVQPQIPQNPSAAYQSQIDAALKEWQTQHFAFKQKVALATAAHAASMAAAAAAAASGDEPKRGGGRKGGKTDEKSSASAAAAAAAGPAAGSGAGASASSDAVSALMKAKHVLSKEQHLYYEQVTSAIKGSDYYVRHAALKSIAGDAGLHQLLPYLIHFIADEVMNNLRDLPLLRSLMAMTHCVLTSPHLHVEPYLHQLLPPVLTCLVGKRLCSSASDDHWALREYAASLIALVCKRFGFAYADLQPRITKTLIAAFLDPTKPLTTHYGAIVGLSVLGHNVTRVLLLPHVSLYLKLLEPVLQSSNKKQPSLNAAAAAAAAAAAVAAANSNSSSAAATATAATATTSTAATAAPAVSEQTRLEAQYCYGALLRAVGQYVRLEWNDITATAATPSGAAAVAAAASAAATANAAAAEDAEEADESESGAGAGDGDSGMSGASTKSRAHAPSAAAARIAEQRKHDATARAEAKRNRAAAATAAVAAPTNGAAGATRKRKANTDAAPTAPATTNTATAAPTTGTASELSAAHARALSSATGLTLPYDALNELFGETLQPYSQMPGARCAGYNLEMFL